MGIIDHDDNDQLDYDEAGKVLLYGDDYDSIPHNTDSGCSCRSIVIAVIVIVVLGVIIAMKFAH